MPEKLTPSAAAVIKMARSLIGALVSKPNALEFFPTELNGQLTFEYRGHYLDHSRLVGAGGKTVNATFHLLKIAGAQAGLRVVPKLDEPKGGGRPVKPTHFEANDHWQAAPMREMIEEVISMTLPRPAKVDETHFRRTSIFHVVPDKRDRAFYENNVERELSLLANAAGMCQGRSVILDQHPSGEFTVTKSPQIELVT